MMWDGIHLVVMCFNQTATTRAWYQPSTCEMGMWSFSRIDGFQFSLSHEKHSRTNIHTFLFNILNCKHDHIRITKDDKKHKIQLGLTTSKEMNEIVLFYKHLCQLHKRMCVFSCLFFYWCIKHISYGLHIKPYTYVWVMSLEWNVKYTQLISQVRSFGTIMRPYRCR